MPETRQLQEVSLAELTGRKVDAEAFYLSLLPRLTSRGISLAEYGKQQLALHSDLVAKIISYGERTPAAPYLGEISLRLGKALHLDEGISDQEITELLAHFKREVEEAEDHFGK